MLPMLPMLPVLPVKTTVFILRDIYRREINIYIFSRMVVKKSGNSGNSGNKG